MNTHLRAGKQLCVLACVTLLLVLSGCMREPETALRIGTNVWIGSEPLYLARELGRLDPAAVQLVEYPSASEVLRAFRNQAIDGMVISLDELFGLAVDGLQPRIILVVDVSHGADVVVGRSGMRTMKDLKGKSVAVESGALGAFVLSRAPAVNGMQASDVNVVHLSRMSRRARSKKGRSMARSRLTLIASPPSGRAPRRCSTAPDSGEIVDLLAVACLGHRQGAKAIQALLAGWFDAIDYMNRDLRMRRGAWEFASKRPGNSSGGPEGPACSFPRRKSQNAQRGDSGWRWPDGG
jgi:NitT/TauT family transport system substrate-binding protein